MRDPHPRPTPRHGKATRVEFCLTSRKGDAIASLTIRDNALWAKHIDGDPGLVERILALPENSLIVLMIDGQPVNFRKMRDGKDRRPTPGLRPDAASRPYWDAMQRRRGEVVRIELPDAAPDPDLGSLTSLLHEWASTADAEAYDRL